MSEDNFWGAEDKMETGGFGGPGVHVGQVQALQQQKPVKTQEQVLSEEMMQQAEDLGIETFDVEEVLEVIEDDYSSVMDEVENRLAKGNLYRMLIDHDLFVCLW